MQIFRRLVERFVAWNHKPREMTPDEVARFLRSAIDGTATHRAMDYFISIDIADPKLNEIKDEVGLLYGPGWEDDDTRDKLYVLLHRVEALMH